MNDPAMNDPYGETVQNIASSLEEALGDHNNGKMNEREFQILETLARVLIALDPAVEIHPYVG